MALKRRSALQAAEKLVARGRLEAAVKQYRKALEDSPDDTGTLNRLGDLYARLNRVSEAVEMFTTAAKHFTKEGFFVKAIAIYKKIIRLDPTLINVYETLADLYYRQGLVNEARAQYQVVADYYKQSNNQQALVTVYEKMVELEPDNPSHRLKLAEFYCSSDRIPEAMEQYQGIATFMLEHGKVEESFKVYLGAFELKPDDLGFLTDVIVQLTDFERPNVARRLLDAAIAKNPDAARVAELVDLPAPGPGTEPVAAAEVETAPSDSTETAAKAEEIDREAVAEEELEPVAEAAASPADGEVSAVVELDLDQDQDPTEIAELLGADAGALESLGPPPGVDAVEISEPAVDEADLVDLADLVSLDRTDAGSVEGVETTSAVAAEEEPEAADAKDETGEFEIDLGELEKPTEEEIVAPLLTEAAEPAVDELAAEAPGEEPAAVEEKAVALGAAADALPEAEDEDPAVRAGELVTEASVLANYSLESKAVDLLETALDLVPGHLEAGKLLLHLHHQAERSEDVCQVAQSFVREGELPAPLAELLRDWSYSLEDGLVSAPVEVTDEAPPPAVEVEAPAGPETKLTWLDEDASTPEEADLFGDEDQFFDLAGELEEELMAEESKLESVSMPQLEEQSIEEIVEGFKQGVAETLSSEDFDTHFNLGIAYREMGLVDEAIGEFQLAAKSERYLVDCCSLLGASFLEKGFSDLAVKWYERGLKAPGASEEEKLGLLYELGNLYLTTGDKETAKDTFAEIYGANSNYRDVVAKLEELRQT